MRRTHLDVLAVVLFFCTASSAESKDRLTNLAENAVAEDATDEANGVRSDPPAKPLALVPAGGATAEPDPKRSDPEVEFDLIAQEVPLPARPGQIEPRAPVPPAARAMAERLYGPGEVTRRFLARERQERAGRPGTDVVVGGEATVRPSSDAGSLLGKSQSTLGVGVQRRTPIVTDTRSRGNHQGQLLAAGSYWVPARQDLDTLLSKIDASLINDVIVIKGPYSSRYGPGFSFVDTELLSSPRYENGPEWHGRSSLNYQTNGQQWYGRQTLLGGSSDWGFRTSYGHRTDSDYESGDGTDIPSSFNSRDLDTALGFDLSPDSHLEFSYLRLDQTDVEFPGQIFDIDFLVTDAYELKYTLDNQCYFDRLTLDTWYNRTRFEGDAQHSGKRRQIPQLNAPLNFVGFTDVDSMSTGYSLAATWGNPDGPQLTAGVDLRYIEQELNEVDSFTILVGGVPIPRGPENLPIPRSHSSNPGLFLEQVLPLDDQLTLKAGTRVDWVATNIEGSPPGRTRADLKQLLATNRFWQPKTSTKSSISGQATLRGNTDSTPT
ncbi:MAG: TonB-dependent receptor [Planctomycetes bacterium]|nr:TonB-dependent receptor [Planctomycetota bacterium]